MEIQITSRHSKTSESLKETITDELNKLEKFYDKFTSCHVVLDNDAADKSVEIVINLNSHTVAAIGKAENVGKALDEAITKAGRQIQKISQKIKEHKATRK